jgi:hypothetical protein
LQSPEQFACSEDLQNYKSELANKQIIEAGYNEKLKKTEDNEVVVVSPYENMQPEERARKMLYRLCFESTDLSESEKQVLKESMTQLTVRIQVSDFFLAFMSPRNIRSESCLETIGEVINHMFDCILGANPIE